MKNQFLTEISNGLRVIFNTVADISFIITEAGKPDPLIMDFSCGSELLFGYTAAEVTGSPVSTLHLNNDVPDISELYNKKTHFSGEVWMRKASGQSFLALCHIYPLIENPDNINSYLCVYLDITQQKVFEEDLLYRIEFEQLITNIASRFIHVKAEQIESMFEITLKDLSEFLKIDHSCLYLFNDGLSSLSLLSSWTHRDIRDFDIAGESFSIELFSWAVDSLKQSEVLRSGISNSCIPEGTFFEEFNKRNNILSWILVPVTDNESLSGVLCMSTIKNTKEWDVRDIPLLKVIGEIIADAIEKNRIELALSQSEDRFKKMADSIQEGLTIIERGKVVYVNNELCEITGRTREELFDMTGLDLAVRDEHDRIRDQILENNDAGKVVDELEFWIERPDGEKRYIRNRYTVKRWSDWITDRYIVTNDITEKHLAQEELIRLGTAVEQASEDIIVTDINGVIQYVNPAFEKITGFPKNEVVGRKPSVVKSGRHSQKFYKELWETITSGKVWTGRMINKTKEGEIIEEEATISPIRNNINTIIGFVSVKRDITEQVKLEAQLAQAQKMEAIGTLAGGLAHDFNNILAGILGSIDLLSVILNREQLSNREEINSYIMTLKHSSKRATDLIKQLLSLSKRHELEFVPIDLSDSINNVYKICKNTFPKSIFINIKNLPSAVILGDPTQIEQVILNIMVNASHAMTIMRDYHEKDGGEIKISLERFIPDKLLVQPQPQPDLKQGQNYYKIEITDNGIGMDKETLDRIFNPFFTMKSIDIGTGLGLSMVYNIIRQHHGFIDVQSTPGKGSVFKMYLPEFQIRPFTVEEVHEEQVEYHGQGLILIIDDEEMVLKVASGMMKMSGFDVISVTDSREGLKIFQKRHREIDAVMLDMSMPNMSGYDVFMKLKKIDSSVKVLLSSGFKQDERVKKLLELGVNDFLEKPFTLDKLITKLNRILK